MVFEFLFGFLLNLVDFLADLTHYKVIIELLKRLLYDLFI